MGKAKLSNLKIRDIEPFEHLEFIVKNTTPYQRYIGLEQLWNLWYERRKTLPKKILKLQDKFRAGEI